MNDGGDCRTAPATPGLLINELVLSYVFRMAFSASLLVQTPDWFKVGQIGPNTREIIASSIIVKKNYFDNSEVPRRS